MLAGWGFHPVMILSGDNMMTVTLSDFAPMYGKMLDTAAHLLATGKAFAAEKGIAESEMLGWRLAEDMNPLS
jgi:hypothetical protein